MAWWKKDKEGTTSSVPGGQKVPTAEAEPDRYKGRPLLIILENYVLDCIGSLSADKEEGIRAVVQRIFGGGPDWKAAVRQKLDLPATIDQKFVQMWIKNQEIAKQAGQTLHPIQFAKMIVDSNFASLIGPPIGS